MTTARILVVDDESEIRSLIQEILSEEGYEVTMAADAQQARDAVARSNFDLVLLDIWMPDMDGITLLREWSEVDEMNAPVVMISGHGTVETAVEATRLGAVDYIEKPISLTKLLHTVERALQKGQERRRNKGRQILSSLLVPVGRSKTMQRLREQARKLAPHEAPVLITGEPGSGREAFARYLHSISQRAGGPLVAIVAASLTPETAELQLFGQEGPQGRETGALARARGGVLFIDDVSSLGDAAQGLLLSALELNAYKPMGSTHEEGLDVRLITSAPADFESYHPGFRQNLLSHLNVLTLRLPPLRDYAEDVPELLRYYVDLLIDSENLPFRRFSVAAQNRLRNYPWPGNVRELKNLVHRMLIVGGEEEITLEEVETELEAVATDSEPLVKQDLLGMPMREAREHFERAYLQQQLMLCNGKVGKLAQRVGMERTHLYRKLRLLGVDFRQSADE